MAIRCYCRAGCAVSEQLSGVSVRWTQLCCSLHVDKRNMSTTTPTRAFTSCFQSLSVFFFARFLLVWCSWCVRIFTNTHAAHIIHCTMFTRSRASVEFFPLSRWRTRVAFAAFDAQVIGIAHVLTRVLCARCAEQVLGISAPAI